ncbi:hypothetical protein [Desulfotignum phosphitoxidans]|uniref:Uncharacterized protein n=1 Tax=Desulfotignum phosphitoxidans DSM 13687 TaxID=1286635 RepID=S0G195_9BACT|nr:hypothetical protein [Desulfotignum phosphitoxidans]EMS79204.1 hypothetical protein Dpo_5c01270 [Desulfotignum phosphitoxidans DSM 13687]
MQFSVLEVALMGGLFTSVGAIVAGIIIRILSDKKEKNFVTYPECAARHASDCRMSDQLIAKIDEMKTGQEKFQESVDAKNSLVFRMLRSMVVYMDIPQEQKERILNERAGD